MNVQADLLVQIKAVIYSCVPGYSCYVLFTKNDGVNAVEAEDMCAGIGGHLVRYVPWVLVLVDIWLGMYHVCWYRGTSG